MGNPKGDKNRDGAMYCSKVSSPQKKELKFMPLGISRQNRFDLEQYLKNWAHWHAMIKLTQALLKQDAHVKQINM
jgi:hypothetical protein